MNHMVTAASLSDRRVARRRRHRRLLLATILAGAATLVQSMPAASAPASTPSPVFAYYYIWFDPSSWNRAKTDFPALGRYSSDERLVMQRHVRWAKAAGIEGFIVSWKSTPTLDERLRRLAKVARAERFELLVIYQGLDFEREPLPAARIARDLDVFKARYARHPAFDKFGRPLVVWSGTWRFSAEEIARVTASRGSDLLILASERNLDGYRRVAPYVNGNAYYWSSVNPETFPGYDAKLTEMGTAVHQRNGIWIAPAAPGFDARLIGGTTVVPRRNGATLRRELDAATRSSPDAIGLISWNEFSENTHIEPSVRHGARYLEVLADVRGATVDIESDLDSGVPGTTGRSYGPAILAGLLALVIGAAGVAARRARTRRRSPGAKRA
jgi:Glycosyl hydrolase family 99